MEQLLKKIYISFNKSPCEDEESLANQCKHDSINKISKLITDKGYVNKESINAHLANLNKMKNITLAGNIVLAGNTPS